IALLIGRTKGESWMASLRRVAPLFGVALVWLPVWLRVMARGVHEGLAFSPGAGPAALLHLAQSFLGLQWGPSPAMALQQGLGVTIPLAIVSIGVVAAANDAPIAVPGRTPAISPVALGIAWGVLAAVPVFVVVRIWCSYYYLFAICGLAVALAAA